MSLEKRLQAFKKLETLVNARGITLYRMAKDLGYKPSMFSEWKRGKSMPNAEKLVAIAKYLGVTVEYLIS